MLDADDTKYLEAVLRYFVHKVCHSNFFEEIDIVKSVCFETRVQYYEGKCYLASFVAGAHS